MKYEDDSTVVTAHAGTAFALAADDVLSLARNLGAAHSRSGTWDASLRLAAQVQSDGNLSAVIGSSLVRGPALEFGANVGPRRGPHMTGIFVISRAMDTFGARVMEHLQSTPMTGHP